MNITNMENKVRTASIIIITVTCIFTAYYTGQTMKLLDHQNQILDENMLDAAPSQNEISR